MSNPELNNLFMTFHNSHSRNAVKLFADTCTALSCKNVIYSKITASAASIGIPEAQKSILKGRGNIFFFSDIEDILEILKPEKIYLLVSRKYGKNPIPFSKIASQLKDFKVLVILGGTSPGLTRKELDLGSCIFSDVVKMDINSIALTAIFLNGLIKAIEES
ncbi:MAG: RecB-family nuclease [Candidatus Hodarchaeales archaeon]